MDTQANTRLIATCRGLCFCALLAGLLLLPLADLHAAPVLSGGVKKAVKQQSIAQVGKKTAGKDKAKKAAKETKVAKANKGKTGKKADKATRPAKGDKAVAKTRNAPKNRSGKTANAVVRGEIRTDRLLRGRAVENPQVAVEGAPFLKRRAIFDADTRLANTLHNHLGVEVLEDPRHSGGLFIAPPNAAQGDHAARALDLLTNLPLGLPLDVAPEISSGFGGRRDPFNKRRAFHEGIDFRAKTGTRVYATGRGKVAHSGYSPDYGENIIVSHGKGYESMFAHLSKRLAKVGDEVGPGDLIGLVGSTGRSTGAHLHYEIRYKGAPIDPTDYIKATQQAQLPKK